MGSLSPAQRLIMFLFFIPIAAASPLPVEGTAQPLLQLQPTVTPTMDGLMGLRAPTSATCTSRTRPTLPAFQGVGVTLTIAVIRQTPTATLTAMTPTAARTPMPVVGEPSTPAS